MGLFEGQNIFTRAFKVDPTLGASGVLDKRFVLLTATGVNYPTAGARVLGVTLEGADTDGGALPYPWPNRPAVAVRILGTAFVEAAGAIALGAEVETDAQGRAAAKNTGATVGIAMSAASAAGDLIEVLLVRA